MATETIFLIEDELGLREFIQMFLTKRGYEVVVAADGKQALELIDYIKPDLILLDIEMPGIDGFEVCRQIRMKMTIPILFISCRKDVMDKLKCFELGGDDYLSKPFDFAELEARIKANLRQYRGNRQDEGAVLPRKVIKHGDLKIDIERYKCYISDDLVTLSIKEMKLLMLLAKHPNQIWSAEQLYDHVWGIDQTGDISTVKVHISRLRGKLEKSPSEPQYIQTVRGFGYLFAANT